jgi:hypothetical protein
VRNRRRNGQSPTGHQTRQSACFCKVICAARAKIRPPTTRSEHPTHQTRHNTYTPHATTATTHRTSHLWAPPTTTTTHQAPPPTTTGDLDPAVGLSPFSIDVFSHQAPGAGSAAECSRC